MYEELEEYIIQIVDLRLTFAICLKTLDKLIEV
jgi:hypothetical protein